MPIRLEGSDSTPSEYHQSKEPPSFGRMLTIEGTGHALIVLDKYIEHNGWNSLNGVSVVMVRPSPKSSPEKWTYVVIDVELLKYIKKHEFDKDPAQRLITKQGMKSAADKVFGEEGALINAHQPETYHAHKDMMTSLLTAIKPEQIIIATEELMAKLQTTIGSKDQVHIKNLKKLIRRWATSGLGGSVIHAHLGDREKLADLQEDQNNGMIWAILMGFTGLVNGPRKEIERHILENYHSPELIELLEKISRKIARTTGKVPDPTVVAKDYVSITEVASMASIDTTLSATLSGLERLHDVQKTNPDYLEQMIQEAQMYAHDPQVLREAVMRGKLKHIQSFVLEVLRLADVVKTSGVKAYQDIPINESESIPQGATVMPDYQHISQDPAYWGGDAAFNEGRFIDVLAENSMTTSEYLLQLGIPFVTFALEDRSCTGMAKAIAALTIFFALYLNRVGSEFEIVETNTIRMEVGDLTAAHILRESEIKLKRKK